MVDIAISSAESPCLNSEPSFLSIIQEVQSEATRITGLNQYLSRHNRYRFLTDLTIVALSVRTGYLVDLFTPNDPVRLFSSLLAALRINTKTNVFFARVFHLYEPHSEQSFFINAQLLLERIHTLSGGSESPPEYPLFIHLHSSVTVIYEVPQQVLQVLISLLPLAQSVELPLSFSLLSDTTFETAVPLAAILLDYLVAYVPYTTYPNTLSGVPLDVYECILAIPGLDSREHSIIKFSCPTTVQEGFTQLKPENITLKLGAIFSNRLGATRADGATIRVKHSSETVDRIVF
ncbi:hypothetical protein BYT27DRAFT_7202704 [Phlegmacium glaucopus]|nr:hypothetical protein BYT27DRAFT_7202704 [Phlegmacium glaucopus]